MIRFNKPCTTYKPTWTTSSTTTVARRRSAHWPMRWSSLASALGPSAQTRPAMSLADLAGRPEPEPAVEEAAPEDNSQAAALLARLGA